PAPAAKPTPAPAAKPGETPAPAATASGNFDKDQVRAVVRRHIDEIRFCYEQSLVDKPELGGRFIVRMTVLTENGAERVSEAEIVPADDGYLDSPTMQSCVLAAVSRWKFPASDDGEPVVIDYPFVFKAAQD